MKKILSIVLFAGSTIMFGCAGNNDNDGNNANGTLDSIGNPSTNPSSTSVLVEDSSGLRNDTIDNTDTTKH